MLADMATETDNLVSRTVNVFPKYSFDKLDNPE